MTKKVIAVPEIKNGNCDGCVYDYDTQASEFDLVTAAIQDCEGAKAKYNCTVNHTILVSNTNKGKAAYVALRLETA